MILSIGLSFISPLLGATSVFPGWSAFCGTYLATISCDRGSAVQAYSGMMGMNLFTYGSLMFDEVWSQLVRGDYVKRSARLQGFARRRVHGDVYPVIVRAGDCDWVDGVVYFGVDEHDLRRLDLFEAEPYDRQTHIVVVDGCEKHRADAYVLKDDYRHMIHDCEWDPQWFEREALPIFIGSYRGFH